MNGPYWNKDTGTRAYINCFGIACFVFFVSTLFCESFDSPSSMITAYSVNGSQCTQLQTMVPTLKFEVKVVRGITFFTTCGDPKPNHCIAQFRCALKGKQYEYKEAHDTMSDPNECSALDSRQRIPEIEAYKAQNPWWENFFFNLLCYPHGESEGSMWVGRRTLEVVYVMYMFWPYILTWLLFGFTVRLCGETNGFGQQYAYDHIKICETGPKRRLQVRLYERDKGHYRTQVMSSVFVPKPYCLTVPLYLPFYATGATWIWWYLYAEFRPESFHTSAEATAILNHKIALETLGNRVIFMWLYTACEIAIIGRAVYMCF